MEILKQFQNYAMVALGLGFVIFIHELGHFLVAKWNGVKVLKFSIGFGPALISYRRGLGVQLGSSAQVYAERARAAEADDSEAKKAAGPPLGETEYAIRLLPLGGAVHMLGEGTDEGEKPSDDPRAYSNRPVGARMAIISAGVIMNLLFGWACFTAVYLIGTDEMPAVVARVLAGTPAYEAGMRPGDEIIAIDGRRDVSFTDLQRTVALSGTGQVVRLELRRPGRAEPISLALVPDRGPDADVPGIGIRQPIDTTLFVAEPFERPPGMNGQPEARGERGGFAGGDQVIALGAAGETPRKVQTYEDLRRALAAVADRPIDVVVRRAPTKAETASKEALSREVTVNVPVNRFLDLGFRLAIGPITSVRGDSPAASAGFRKGDVIVKVDGRDDFDPMRLPFEIYRHAGTPVTIEVERPSGAGGAAEHKTFTVTPDDSPPWDGTVYPQEPLDVPGLGLAYGIGPKVTGVAPGSPAAKAGLEPGQVIRSVDLTITDAKGKELLHNDYPLEPSKPGWPFLFSQLQEPGARLAFNIQGRKGPIPIEGRPDPAWFNPMRGFQFRPLIRPLPPQGLAASLRRGGRETVDVMSSVYATIRGLIQQRLGRKAVGGPIGIIRAAYAHASAGGEAFAYFLGMLSVNLAVINFLPIFPLDGGQLLFLLAEKVRGRPLPDRVHVPLMIAGLVFVLLLMVFATFNDIRSWIFPTR